MQIYFVRHAHVAYDNRLSAKYRLPTLQEHLSPLGWAQALELDYLMSEQGLRFDRILASDYCRAIETVLPVALRNGLSIKQDKRLRELKWHGDLTEFKSQSELNPDFCFPGGESLNRGYQRFAFAVREACAASDAGDRILVGTHGVILEQFLARVFPQIEQPTLKWPDVVAMKWEQGSFKQFEWQESLVPSNSSGLEKLYFYPIL